ncbi:MAG: protein kinase [Gemmataceae bacterium]
MTPRNAVALVIGIGTYQRQDRIASLSYAERDARSMARILTRDTVCGFPPAQVRLLTGARADRTSLVDQLARWLPEASRGCELVMIYFAGHGTVESLGSREEGYLLPYDTDPDAVAGHGIAMTDLARWIEGLDAQAVLVCLDCCHAGGILPGAGVSLRATERDMQLRPSHLERLGGRGRFLIASCDRGQKSIEADELRHGLFTYHLLKGLLGAGDRDGDGRVGIGELFGYVSGAVSRDARTRFQREQTPWTWATYNEEIVLSVVPSTREARQTQRPVSTAPPVPAEDLPLLEQLRQLRKKPDPVKLPLVFRQLGHRSEPVRTQARQALAALEWGQVISTCERLARATETEAIPGVLDGLEALETHPRVIDLLDRLAGLLRGSLRDRAVSLLDRKRLAQERERLAGVFRETQSIYEILKVLGAGTYTGAYLARQEMTGLDVVVRVLRKEYASQPLIRGHFLDLGARAIRLVHQNLVLTREVRSLPDSGLYFVVRDFIRGVTLRELLDAGRVFDPPQACKILRQVLEALTPLHREGLVHAGVKPSNIFLTREDQVILGDPSLPVPAMGLDLPRLSYDYRYAPPELFRAGTTLGPTADFYSLGCVAYELLQGQALFASDSPFELIARHERDRPPPLAIGAISAAVQTWLNTLLAKQPHERCTSIDQALAGLDDLLRTRKRRSIPGDAVRLYATPVSSPPPPPPTLGATSGPAESVRLLNEGSLDQFENRQSIVPLTHGDGGLVVSLNEAEPPGRMGPVPTVPGYDILEELGRGGMGVVYKARDTRLDRLVALKMILHGGHSALRDQQRFLREAQSAAAVQHPHIVQVYELGMHEGLPFVALEFCPGRSLAHRLSQGRLTMTESVEMLVKITRAMQAAHAAGIVHRDLKPANVLIDAAGQPKVSDFGLARQQREESNLTQTGDVLGTPAYMAPEQALGRREVGPATDIYALGVILYECLAGHPPFRSGSMLEVLNDVVQREPVPLRQMNEEVPRDLEQVVKKCLAKDPARRYGSAAELADDLDRWLVGSPPASQPVRKGWNLWPFRRKE